MEFKVVFYLYLGPKMAARLVNSRHLCLNKLYLHETVSRFEISVITKQIH